MYFIFLNKYQTDLHLLYYSILFPKHTARPHHAGWDNVSQFLISILINTWLSYSLDPTTPGWYNFSKFSISILIITWLSRFHCEFSNYWFLNHSALIFSHASCLFGQNICMSLCYISMFSSPIRCYRHCVIYAYWVGYRRTAFSSVPNVDFLSINR